MKQGVGHKKDSWLQKKKDAIPGQAEKKTNELVNAEHTTFDNAHPTGQFQREVHRKRTKKSEGVAKQ